MSGRRRFKVLKVYPAILSVFHLLCVIPVLVLAADALNQVLSTIMFNLDLKSLATKSIQEAATI